MKKMKFLFVLLAAFAMTSCIQPGNTTDPNADKGPSQDEKDVAAITEQLTKLIITPDKKALEDIAADQLTYCHSGGKLQDKAQFVEDLVSGPFDFLTVDITNQKITMSGTVAVVRQDFHATATNAGVPAEVTIGNCLVWQKQGEKWKLLARQAFKVPPPPAPVAPAVKK